MREVRQDGAEGKGEARGRYRAEEADWEVEGEG